jgi:hypothetical protein
MGERDMTDDDIAPPANTLIMFTAIVALFVAAFVYAAYTDGPVRSPQCAGQEVRDDG